MPTYDYQCRSCGNVIEVIHPMTADGPSVCELCGGELRRVLYPAGIIFKGSGFYRTDSRAASGSSEGGSSSTSTKGSGASKETSGADGSASSSGSSGAKGSGSAGTGTGSSGSESAA